MLIQALLANALMGSCSMDNSPYTPCQFNTSQEGEIVAVSFLLGQDARITLGGLALTPKRFGVGGVTVNGGRMYPSSGYCDVEPGVSIRCNFLVGTRRATFNYRWR